MSGKSGHGNPSRHQSSTQAEESGASVSISNRAVAIIDVLGFSDMVNSNDLGLLAREYERWVNLAEKLNRPESLGADRFGPIGTALAGPFCDKHIFSDSIFLVSLGSDPLSTLKLLLYSWALTRQMMASCYPVRGGIAYGEYYENRRLGVHLGRAITTAADLEKRQEWIGIALDDSVVKNIRQEFPSVVDGTLQAAPEMLNILILYDVPIKENRSQRLYTLNWRWNFDQEADIRSLFSNPPVEAVRRKIENTEKYVKEVAAYSMVPPELNRLLPDAMRYCGIQVPAPRK